MGIVSAIVVFLLTWWMVLFAVLPFGIKHPAQQETGMMPGAPLKPDFKKIILRTTLISIVIWAIIFALVESDVISFRQMAKTM
jgi:predicted secreted protein